MPPLKVAVMMIALVAGHFAQASVKHTKALSPNNIEMWCGSASSKARNEFPYVAAIRKYKAKKGHTTEIVTVYKNGRAVMKDYVSKSYKGSEAIYLSRDQDFKLDLISENSLNSLADFRAVIHERDGDTLVANGQFPCHRQGS